MSTVLWKQEQAHFGLEQAGREMEERHVWLLSGFTPMYRQGIHFELIFGAHQPLKCDLQPSSVQDVWRIESKMTTK